MLATLSWLLALELFALASYPLAYRVFSRLPDRGWALSKPLGLLLVGLGTWGIGLSHVIVNSRLSVALALAIVALLSWRAARGRTAEMRAFLQAHLSLVLSTELLFIAAFVGVAALRAAVSDIAHTEQPMDLMFLNAVVTSPYYPPNDPWLAGAAVSYYYMGYLFMGTLALFTGLATPVAYNLGLATAAALGGVAAFGLTFNLIRLARGSENGAVLGGAAAAFLLLVASTRLRCARRNARISAVRPRAARHDSTSTMPSASATDSLELTVTWASPIPHVPRPTSSRPSGLLKAHPRSGRRENARYASGNEARLNSSSARNQYSAVASMASGRASGSAPGRRPGWCRRPGLRTGRRRSGRCRTG